MSKRILTLVVAAAFIFALVGVSTAKAATVEELTALIAQLQAQIAALTGGSTTAAGEITKDLTIGSRGDQVEILQKYLEDEGYLVMPVGVAYGYFGNLTKAAVAKWQADNGVAPAYGYFGPISRAKYATLNPVTPVDEDDDADEVATELGDTDGSISASRDNYVTDQTLKKGETKNIYAVKLQATAGKVAVTRFDVRMNVRPYLYFNKLTLKDSNGTVIAEKAISGASDVTELTAGSDYLIRFDNINYVVEPNNNKILVVSASVLPTTDKLSTSVTVRVMVGPNGIRTINGKGFTDSLGVGTAAFAADYRTVTLSSTGSTGNIVARLNSNSPLTRTQAISTSGETEGVVLGIFDVKAENQDSTIEGLDLTLTTTGADPDSFIKKLYVVDGSRTYWSDTIAASSTFRSLSISLPKDEWKSLTVKADIADADDIKVTASTTVSLKVQTGNPTGIDANYSSLSGTANEVAASKVTFSTTSLAVSNMSVASGQGIVAVANGPVVKYPVAYTFTLTNNGDTNLYVSKLAGALVGTTTVPADNATSTLSEIQPIAAVSGDTDDAYVITSNGGSRTFTLNGTVGQDAGTAGSSLRISQINYGTTAANPTGSTITAGLEPLYKSFTF